MKTTKSPRKEVSIPGKAVKCPYCKEEINSLNQDEMVWARYKCYIDKGGYFRFDEGEIEDTADENSDNRHYYCPECDEEITDKYDQANAFLLGEKLPEGEGGRPN